MIERPILFSAPMVRAILDGTKTQTRRVAPVSELRIRPRADGMCTWGVSFYKPVKGALGSHSGGRFTEYEARSIIASQFNPYGQPGDRLWVRECWARDDEDGALMYRADLGQGGDADDWERNRIEGVPRYRWRPSIHMPRWASRITLEITGVRVERLQDISRGDAMDEGCPFANMAQGDDPRQWYGGLWDAINGPGSWEANPWVWVVEFKRDAPEVKP